MEISDELLEEILDTIANEPAVLPFRFIFITVNNSIYIIAQLLALRNIKRYKVFIHENVIILIKRKKNLSNILHIAPEVEFIF